MASRLPAVTGGGGGSSSSFCVSGGAPGSGRRAAESAGGVMGRGAAPGRGVLLCPEGVSHCRCVFPRLAEPSQSSQDSKSGSKPRP